METHSISLPIFLGQIQVEVLNEETNPLKYIGNTIKQLKELNKIMQDLEIKRETIRKLQMELQTL